MGDGNDVTSNNAWVRAGRPLFEGVASVISHELSRGSSPFPILSRIQPEPCVDVCKNFGVALE